jgi:hypothetical protein
MSFYYYPSFPPENHGLFVNNTPYFSEHNLKKSQITPVGILFFLLFSICNGIIDSGLSCALSDDREEKAHE